jgi:hypothetical protein
VTAVKLFALALVTAAAVVAAAITGSATAAKPPKPGSVSLSVKPTVVTYGQAVTLSGKAAGAGGGTAIDLQRDPFPFGDGFATQKTVAATGGGAFNAVLLPTASTEYRATSHTSPAVTSNSVLVVVRFAVGLRVSTLTPRRGARVTFSGSVRPVAAGRRATLQCEAATGAWAFVAATAVRKVTASRSAYAIRVRVRSGGTYRVRVGGDAAHATGFSVERTVAVV